MKILLSYRATIPQIECSRVCDVEQLIEHIKACKEVECPSQLFVKNFGEIKESWDIRREVNKLHSYFSETVDKGFHLSI